MVNALFTDFGSVVATTLHTAGAIAYLAGLVAFVSWSRHLRQGQHQKATLALGQTLAYVGILANLTGGFIRTYQPGHPKFWDFGASGWATVMVLKHAALFLGIGLAVYLFEVLAPRLRRIWKEQGSSALPERAGRLPVYGVAASIFLAAVLGAWTTVLPVDAGGLEGADADGADAMGDGHGAVAFEPATYSFEGTASTGGTPTSGPFEVPVGTAAVDAFLYASQAVGVSPFHFTLTLVDPDGTQHAASTDPQDPGVDPAAPEAPRREVGLLVEDPVPGTWTYRVSGDAAVGANWQLTVAAVGPEGIVLEDTVTLDGSFYEINLNIADGGVLNWDWRTEDGTAIHFDVHRHVGAGAEYEVDGDYAAHNGTHTSDSDTGISLLWDNGGSQPVTLHYRVWGDFRVHSIFS